MYVCTRISDDFLAGAQGHAPRPGAMENQAALDYGGQAADYAVLACTDAEYARFIAARDAATPGLVEARVRAQRNALLAACDWTALPDAPVDDWQAWADYRQALRDLTAQPGFPLDVAWPTPPAQGA